MKLLWILILLLFVCVLIDGKVVYRTRWPKYEPKNTYAEPVKPKDYCIANLCPAGQKHVTCGKMFWSTQCGPRHEGLDINYCMRKIVKVLNKLRAQVVNGKTQLPQGKEMPEVTWDKELATMAMRVNNQCNDYPVGLCANTMRYREVGESSDFRFLDAEPNINVIGFFRSWFEQASKMQHGDVSNFPSLTGLNPEVLAFANMINSKVTKFGCGVLTTTKKRFITCIFDKRLKPGQQLY
ncbi:hypothetical protein KR200_011089, partial [Drosophila serrata]